MAREIKKKAPAAAEQSSAADDHLQALQPDATLTIAGRTITVREYRFWEGYRVAARAQAFIADMYDMAVAGTLSYRMTRHLFGKHHQVIVEIAAQAADVEPEWIESLGLDDGENFMATWFAVNGRFFTRELVVAERAAQAQKAMASRSTASSSDSAAQESGTTTGSGSSPSVN